MAKILLLFASSYGQTAKVADHLALRWRGQGHEVVCRRLDQNAEPAPAGFDAVILGSRLAIRYAPSLKRYVEKYRTALATKRSAFLSVSMSAASPDPKVGSELKAKIGALFHEARWSPDHVGSFAGALPYSRYDPVTRAVMKLISSRAGHPTDTSRDYEFTDWAKVDEFADNVSKGLTQPNSHDEESGQFPAAAVLH